MFTLTQTTIEERLRTSLLGRPLVCLKSVESTQTIVREAARRGEAEGLAVVAGQQTAGKGRAGRSWWSPPSGGLYLSLLLRPNLPGDLTSWTVMTLTLGAAEAIEQLYGLPVAIKWPNDLLIQGRKLAGVLAEGAFIGSRLDYVVAGIGLNVATDFSSQPELADTAISLEAALGAAVDPASLLVALLEHSERHYLAMQAGVSPLAAWQARLDTLGRPVTVHLADGRLVHGVAGAVLPDGALRIDLDDGGSQEVRAHDVTLRHQS
ncbi:MAG TPA: biotin--[acetyl-CoA-carboxylase] ligase [Anaerolineae bacterium]|nr:biotin--[acetyl-CoA-carboxylase] ligase [Anaerolineae bacterium]HNU04468.1 biotin--[acetyl-CoA-carboxylase] ligase [Anaerolineae bacterium]